MTTFIAMRRLRSFLLGLPDRVRVDQVPSSTVRLFMAVILAQVTMTIESKVVNTPSTLSLLDSLQSIPLTCRWNADSII